MLYLTQIRSAVLLVLLAAICGGMMAQNAPLDPFGADSSYYQGLKAFDYFDQGGDLKNRPGKQSTVHIDDSRTEGTVVYVSEDMYEYVLSWMFQGANQQVPLTDALLRQFDTTDVNDFTLKFQSGDSTYFQKSGEKSGCNCKYLSFSNSAPQRAVVDAHPANPTQYWDESEVFPFPMIPRMDRKAKKVAFGAGRGEMAKIWGQYGLNKSQRKSSGLDARVRMRLAYVCVDGNDLPSNCGCTKDIDIQGDLSGHLYAYANGGIPGRDILTSTEAWVVATEYTRSANFEEIIIRDAKRNMANAVDAADFNPDFVEDIANFAKDVVLGTTGSLDQDIIDDAIDILTTMLTDDVVFHTNKNVHDTTIAAIIDVDTNISPGEEKIFFLGSITSLYNKVKLNPFTGSWGRSVAAFTSAYNLHLTVPFDNSDPSCCMEQYGMWAWGGYNMVKKSRGRAGFSDDETIGPLSAMKSALITNFDDGNWESFDADDFIGSTTSTHGNCGCNVDAGIDVVSKVCNNVIVDISDTEHADSHFLVIWEIDEQGNWAGTQRSGGFTSWPTNQINLSTNNTLLKDPFDPLSVPAPYPFKAGKSYRITLGVSGYCTDWTTDYIEVEIEPDAQIAFDVLNEKCNDVSIQLTNTTGADRFRFAITELDDNNNWLMDKYESSVGYPGASPGGFIQGPLTSNTIDFTDPSSSLLAVGAYPHFEAGKRYIIKVAVTSDCAGWVDAYAIIELEHDVFPEFDLDISCNQVLFDGSASSGVSSFGITIVQVSEFGVPYPATEYIIPGQGAVGTYNLGNSYPGGFVSGNRYRITLSAEGQYCPGRESVSQDFTYSVNPMPVIEGELTVCEDDEYLINIGSSAGVEGYKIEVFPSNQFGVPTGTSTFISGAPGQWVSIPNPVVQIHPSPYPFIGGNYYGIRLHGNNSCTTVEETDLFVVEVIPSSQCDVKLDSETPQCSADFDINPTHTTLTGGTEVEFIGKSELYSANTVRHWTFGDGNSGIGSNSPNHTYSSDGTYSVTLEISDETGCQDLVTKTVSIQGQGGRSRIGQIEGDITIAPNPNKGQFSLNYDLDENATCKLLTVTGNVLMVREMDANAKSMSVTTKDLPAGLYFVQITQKSAVISTQKVLIQH